MPLQQHEKTQALELVDQLRALNELRAEMGRKKQVMEQDLARLMEDLRKNSDARVELGRKLSQLAGENLG